MASPDLSQSISVIIPHLNQPEKLSRCLASLVENTRSAEEIIVVDNGSHSLPDVICREFGAKLLSEPEPGPGPARTLGAHHASGSVLAFTDADCVPSNDWLEVIGRQIRDPSTPLLAGRVVVAVHDPKRMTPVEAYETVFGYRVQRYVQKMGFTVTCNLAMTREVFQAVGPFGGLDIAEDRDWGRRATASGFGFRYVPDMLVRHPARTDMAELRAKWDRQMAHDFQAAKSSFLPKVRFFAKALAMPVSVLFDLPKIIRHPDVVGISNKFRALSGLLNIRLYRMFRKVWLLAGGDAGRLTGAWNRD